MICAVLISDICYYYYYYYYYYIRLVQPLQVHVRVRKASHILHSTEFSTAEASTLFNMNAVGHCLGKGPPASFSLPAPVRASVPLRMRHSTDEKEDYVL
jgi:hypothetical protein